MKRFIPFILAASVLASAAQAEEVTRKFVCSSMFHATDTSRLLTLTFDPSKKEGFGISSVKWAIIKLDASTQTFKIDRELQTQMVHFVKSDTFPVAYVLLLPEGGFARIRALDTTTHGIAEIMIQAERMVRADLNGGLSWAQELQPLQKDKGDSDGIFKLYRWTCSQIGRVPLVVEI